MAVLYRTLFRNASRFRASSRVVELLARAPASERAPCFRLGVRPVVNGRRSDRGLLTRAGVLAAALTLAWGGLAQGQDGGAMATCRDRLEALALMQTLNARILGSRSATASLEAWCGARHLAPEPKVTARLIPGAAKAPTAEQLQRLQVASADEVKYRRVQLVCGGHVLSEADNWYVPGRLTPEMNRLLETTDTPFGRAVQALEPYRQTFSARLLWVPLPEGWEGRLAGEVCEGAEGPVAVPAYLFEHRAVLYTGDRRPFSEVGERYTREILAPPER
jgi:chorismate-pyruvate lyase